MVTVNQLTPFRRVSERQMSLQYKELGRTQAEEVWHLAGAEVVPMSAEKSKCRESWEQGAGIKAQMM